LELEREARESGAAGHQAFPGLQAKSLIIQQLNLLQPMMKLFNIHKKIAYLKVYDKKYHTVI
jgi:hypothetical protein